VFSDTSSVYLNHQMAFRPERASGVCTVVP